MNADEKKQENKKYHRGRYERIGALEWDVRELEKKVAELEKQLKIYQEMDNENTQRRI